MRARRRASPTGAPIPRHLPFVTTPPSGSSPADGGAPGPDWHSVVYSADTLGAAELDALPYGMIQLDPRGVILRYSSAESRLSGLTAAECVGRSFFDEIAPCTHVAEFYGEFLEGVRRQQLDVVFGFRFAFRPPVDVRVHMFYSKVTRSVWVKVVNLGPAAE